MDRPYPQTFQSLVWVLIMARHKKRVVRIPRVKKLIKKLPAFLSRARKVVTHYAKKAIPVNVLGLEGFKVRGYKGDADGWVETGNWVNVKSSNVARIRYDAEDHELYVDFKTASYIYYNVPKHVAKNMFNAISMGRFVWRRLRNRYPYARL